MACIISKKRHKNKDKKNCIFALIDSTAQPSIEKRLKKKSSELIFTSICLYGCFLHFVLCFRNWDPSEILENCVIKNTFDFLFHIYCMLLLFPVFLRYCKELSLSFQLYRFCLLVLYSFLHLFFSVAILFGFFFSFYVMSDTLSCHQNVDDVS